MDRAGHGRDRRLGRSQPFRRRRGARSHAARSPGTKRSGGAPVNSAPSAPLRRLGDAELGHARRSDASDESEDGAARLRARVSHASRDGWGLGVRPLALSAALLVAFLLAGVLAFVAPPAARAEAPAGQVTWAVHVSLAPTWFDPAETTGIITPFLFLYALHDALVKPMPGNPMAPSLAESWTASADGLVYEFVLRKGVRFHTGDPVTAEDVKFSLERYRGTAASSFRERIAAVEVIDPQRVRVRFKQPWPDFMTFYGTPATGAGWIVPKKYVEKVGDDGFKKAPVGAG